MILASFTYSFSISFAISKARLAVMTVVVWFVVFPLKVDATIATIIIIRKEKKQQIHITLTLTHDTSHI